MNSQLELVIHTVILALLLLVALFIATYFAFIPCRAIPGWCKVYKSIKSFLGLGGPGVAIVYGNDGLGDPEALKDALASRCRIYAVLIPLNAVSSGTLSQFSTIIVTRAKTMNVEQLKMFYNHAIRGGKLVWIGDAGTKYESDSEIVYASDLNPLAPKKPLDPWTRKDSEGNIIEFGKLVLGLRYIGNFCDANNVRCGEKPPLAGELLVIKRNYLTQGISYKQYLYSDFAVTQPVFGELISTQVLVSIDTKMPLKFGSKGEEVELKGPFPFIVASNLPGNIIYYSAPPEKLCQLPEESNLCFILENLCDFLES